MSLTTQPERADSIAWLAAVLLSLRHDEEVNRTNPADARSVSIAITPEETAALIDFAAEEN